MNTSTFQFQSADELTIHVYCWLPDDDTYIKGVVQIAHGMAETAARYAEFAEFLTSQGYVVYANDHRGHGKTAGSLDKVGILADSNGFAKLVNDMHQLTTIIQTRHANLPVFLIGHSMGSFATQYYITKWGNLLRGAVLMGSNGRVGPSLPFARALIKLFAWRLGRTAKSPLVNGLVFKGVNDRVSPLRTTYDWLSRDHSEVERYIKDPYCGTLFSVGFFEDFFTGFDYLAQDVNLKNIPTTLPILIASGEADPIGKYGAGLQRLQRTYQQLGICDLTLKLYPGARHELLKETNRQEVFDDIGKWLDKHI